VSKKWEENGVESTTYGRLYSILRLKQMFTLAKEVSEVLSYSLDLKWALSFNQNLLQCLRMSKTQLSGMEMQTFYIGLTTVESIA
jgi:hypothetical protein